MTPKTKFERRVVKLKDSLPKNPPKGMAEWVYKELVTKIGFTKTGKLCYCGHCGNSFDVPKEIERDVNGYLNALKGNCKFCFCDPCELKIENRREKCELVKMFLAKNSYEINCPVCKSKITLYPTNGRIRRIVKEGCCFIDYHGIQLIRNFDFNFTFTKNKPVELKIKPTCTRWISKNGEIATTRPKTMEKLKDESGEKIHSLVGNRIRLAYMYHAHRRYKPWRIPGLENYNIYPVMKFSSYLKLRGIENIPVDIFSSLSYTFRFFGQGSGLHDFISGIIKYPFFETLVKSKNWNLIEIFLDNYRRDVERIIPSFFIAKRHKYYLFEDDGNHFKNYSDQKEYTQLWIDMVLLYQKVGQDIRNPKFICPPDLQKGHEEAQTLYDDWQVKQKQREREEWERTRPRDIWWFLDHNPEEEAKCVDNDEYLYELAQNFGGLEQGWHIVNEPLVEETTGDIYIITRRLHDNVAHLLYGYNNNNPHKYWKIKRNEKFNKLKSKFFNLQFGNDELIIKSLNSWDEYYEEGKAMHNCIESNGYWTKPNSLILSVRKGEESVADVEISLETFKIMQCWGPCNQPTPYREQIEKLIEENVNLIKERME